MSVSSQCEGGEVDNLHMWPPSSPSPPQVLPTPSEIGGAVAWGMSTSGEQLPPPSPFPQPNCAVKWAKSTAASGSFAFIENYSELTLTRNASANGPGRLELSLTGHFEARSYLQYLKEGELGAAAGSWVPGWIFYTTCLMFLKAGCIFCATLLVFKKLLLQKWAHFSVYCYMDLPSERKSSEKKLKLKLTIKPALSEQIFCLNHLKCNILIQPLCAHIWWHYRKVWYLGCVFTALFFYCFPAKLPEIFEQTVAFMGFVWAENCVSIKWNMETLCCPEITDNCPKQFLKYEQVQKLVIFDAPAVQSSHFGKSSKF